LIRRAEERLRDLFSNGEVPGFIHLSIGQEAVSAGVVSSLRAEDTIASTHRGHGHAIAKGIPLSGFFAELLGREQGLCRGRGGSMHVADMSIGMLGANGIVGAGLSIALGSALAHKNLKRDALAVAFFGDGALAEGLVHETFNLSALWHLPLLFVCENNGWSEFQPSAKQISFALSDFAANYKLHYESVDGNDVVAVARIAGRMISNIRAGGGPAVLECMTTRVRGHFEGDPQKYRNPQEIMQLEARDPVLIAKRTLMAMGTKSTAIDQIAAEIDALLDSAIADARKTVPADFQRAQNGVYTSQDGL